MPEALDVLGSGYPCKKETDLGLQEHMDFHQIELIRLSWRQILPQLLAPAKSRVNGETSYVCPFCFHGKNGDGLTFDPSSPGRLHCFGPCGWSGDIIDLYQAMKHRNFQDALEDLSRLLEIDIDRGKTRPVKNIREKDIAQFIADAHKNFIGSPADLYLQSRGISTAVAIACNIGFCERWRHPKVPVSVPATPRLIIPTSPWSYLARDIRPIEKIGKDERKYSKQKVGTVHIFGLNNIMNADKPLFVVEGELDALSLMEIGRSAIALGSVSYINLFLREMAQQERLKQPVIIALDNDNAGKTASEQLLDSLRGQGVLAIDGHEISGTYKDPNEALVAEQKNFEKRVEVEETKAKSKSPIQVVSAIQVGEGHSQSLQVISTKDYLQTQYAADVERFSSFEKRKTGFTNLDSIITLYPGLYALGGISSLGKTTFIHQLSEQLAADGEHVLYFPIEQSAMELVSKGISRTMYKRDPKTAIPSIRLRSGYISDDVKAAQKEYAEVTKTLYVAECNFNTTVMDVRDAVRSHTNDCVKAPIVVIDYLQALRSIDSRMAPREAIDLALRVLKDLQVELSATIITISSLNRVNYLMPIGFESFKESGGIEYTCDVIWGIDLLCMDDSLFDTQGHIKRKREIVNEAKMADPRAVKLVCLKNRYGISSYSATFEYFPAYDTFVPMNKKKMHEYLCQQDIVDDGSEMPLSYEEREAAISRFLE